MIGEMIWMAVGQYEEEEAEEEDEEDEEEI